MHEALGELTVEMIEEIWEIFAFWGAYFGDKTLVQNVVIRVTAREHEVGIVRVDWTWFAIMSEFRSSEIFKELIRHSNLDQFWRVYEYPDLCRPLGEDDFECD
jgi:hypothetical protein